MSEAEAASKSPSGLFFAGIAAVFADRMRWILMGIAVALNGWATLVLLTLRWA